MPSDIGQDGMKVAQSLPAYCLIIFLLVYPAIEVARMENALAVDLHKKAHSHVGRPEGMHGNIAVGPVAVTAHEGDGQLVDGNVPQELAAALVGNDIMHGRVA